MSAIKEIAGTYAVDQVMESGKSNNPNLTMEQNLARDQRKYQKYQTLASIYNAYQSRELNQKIDELNTQLSNQLDISNKLQESALD